MSTNLNEAPVRVRTELAERPVLGNAPVIVEDAIAVLAGANATISKGAKAAARGLESAARLFIEVARGLGGGTVKAAALLYHATAARAEAGKYRTVADFTAPPKAPKAKPAPVITIRAK